MPWGSSQCRYSRELTDLWQSGHKRFFFLSRFFKMSYAHLPNACCTRKWGQKNTLLKELTIINFIFNIILEIPTLYLTLVLVHLFINRKVVLKFFRVSYRACNMWEQGNASRESASRPKGSLQLPHRNSKSSSIAIANLS